MNARQWRKAYMLEFLKNGIVEDVFTFSVPPESENLEFPQRVTETPTFGGVVIDDYGNDTVKIRLAGSTVNEERKLIYRGNRRLPDYLTGEKEIFKLQEIFEKWGELENIAGKTIYLYDLSKMNLLQIAAGSPTRNYWQVVNKSLKIRRDKNKPHTFNYELELIGIVDKGRKMAPLFGGGFGSFLDGVQNVVAVIETVAEITEAIADSIDTLTQQIVNVKRFVEQLERGNALQNTEAILRRLPGGNNLWNATRSVLSTVSKIQYLAGTSESQTNGSSNYLRSDSFTVSFNSGRGSYVPPERVSYGKFATEPEAPVLEKFAFSGWFTDREYQEQFNFNATEIVRNITLYAKWIQTSATVTFNSRQGSVVQPINVDIGERVEAPSPPTRQGFEFEYWCTDSLATIQFSFSTPILGDITLFARWRTVFTITFISNGGSAVETQTVGVGGKAIFPVTPERENFIFGMWCSDITLNVEYNFASLVNSNIILFARWTRVSNNVTFESNGGSAVEMQVVNIGGRVVRPNDPVKEGHTFQRWCSDEALTQEFLFNSIQVNFPMTIYARWIIDTYIIRFEANGGTNTPNQSVNFQGLVVFPPIPTRDGALFQRWCSDEELTTEYDFSNPVTGNMILYADWHEGAN